MSWKLVYRKDPWRKLTFANIVRYCIVLIIVLFSLGLIVNSFGEFPTNLFGGLIKFILGLGLAIFFTIDLLDLNVTFCYGDRCIHLSHGK